MKPIAAYLALPSHPLPAVIVDIDHAARTAAIVVEDPRRPGDGTLAVYPITALVVIRSDLADGSGTYETLEFAKRSVEAMEADEWSSRPS